MPEHLKQHQFQRGNSGNPGGRPKGIERAVRDAINRREFTDVAGVTYKGLDAVLARLLEMLFAKGTAPRDAVAVAKEIFDRGFGKAKQSLELTGDVGGSDSPFAVNAIPLERRRVLLAAALEIEALTEASDDAGTEH